MFENYVLPSENLIEEGELENKINYTINNNSKIRRQLQSKIPEYTKNAINLVN